ncbi:MAG TPA: PaaI family thioesterase [Acidimicrobiales bacterium]|nr:PaaI family thioesterase [Acidimicrobiales bacterium]
MPLRPQVPPPCDLTLGLTCIDKSVPGRTTWTMEVEERFTNPVGILQGGFLAALCDSAMGASSITWAAGEGRPPARSSNAEMKVSFLRAVKPGTTLTCTATVISGGSRVAFVEADVVDDAGNRVARASSTYILLPRPDSTENSS